MLICSRPNIAIEHYNSATGCTTYLLPSPSLLLVCFYERTSRYIMVRLYNINIDIVLQHKSTRVHVWVMVSRTILSDGDMFMHLQKLSNHRVFWKLNTILNWNVIMNFTAIMNFIVIPNFNLIMNFSVIIDFYEVMNFNAQSLMSKLFCARLVIRFW